MTSHLAVTREVADFYDRWSEVLLRHAGSTFQSGLVGSDATTAEESNLLLAEHAGVTAGDHILDAGCGVGGPAIDLALAMPTIRITGVTISQVQAEIATSGASRHGLDDRVEFVVADFHSLPFPTEMFDRVVMFEASGYSYDLDALIAELARVVRPGGAVFFKDVFRLPGNLNRQQQDDLDLMHSLWACTESVERSRLESSLSEAGLHVEHSHPLEVSLVRYLGSMFTVSMSGELVLNDYGAGFLQRLSSLPVEWAEVLAIKP